MKTLQISESNARRLYKTATAEFKQTLEDTFGNEFFLVDVTERVKSYEDACADLGEEPHDRQALMAIGLTIDEIVYRELKTITRALNEDHIPSWDNDKQKWVPYFNTSSGFAFRDADYYYSYAYAGDASRLCFKTKALAEYAGRQFTDLYKAFIK